MIKLGTELDIYYGREDSDKLTHQFTSTITTPFEPHPYALIFASHIFHLEEYPQKVVNKLLKDNFVIIYFCDKIPKNLIKHKHIIYIKTPWRYFDVTTIKNINLFSCTVGVGGDRGLKLAKQYSIKFNKPLINTIEDVNKVRVLLKEEESKKKTILFDVIYQCLDRGLGDVLISTPIIKALKKKFNADIIYACKDNHKELLEHNPDITKIITRYEDMDTMKYTYHLPLIRHTEDYKITRNQQPRIDSMAELFMVEIDKNEDKKPRIYLTEAELEWSRLRVPKNKDVYRIGVNIEATAPSRRWTYEYLIPLMQSLNNATKYKFEIYLFGKGQNLKDKQHLLPGFINNYIHKTTLRQLASMTYRMDLVLSVDSLYSHIAAAFDVPSVIIYTTIPAEWRNKYYRSIGVQSNRKCCPCMDFQFVTKDDYQECRKASSTGVTPCIADITPDIIKENIYKLIKKYRIKPGN
jgi:ADP-heptose:LPS heptosyltransferase